MKEIGGLNWLRGIAAILVLISHTRSFFYVNYQDFVGNPILGKFFYLISGLGTSAVLIFFVLSGYLVAGSVHRSYMQQRWNKYEYFFSRLSRLWVVLLPCLFLTFILDKIGYYIFPYFYNGFLSNEIYSSPKLGVDWSVSTLFGNLVFLQTIYVPVFGSNGPFWSLANEFWYYVLFPFLFFFFSDSQKKYLYAFYFSVICLIIGWEVLKLFPAWLLGYFSYYYRNNLFAKLLLKNVFLCFFLVFVFVLMMIFIRILNFQHHIIGQYIIALSTSILILVLSNDFFCKLNYISNFISKISYSLYLVHFPIIAFIFSMNGAVRYNTISEGLLISFVSIFLSFMIAYLFWYFFERNTNKIKKIMITQFMKIKKND